MPSPWRDVGVTWHVGNNEMTEAEPRARPARRGRKSAGSESPVGPRAEVERVPACPPGKGQVGMRWGGRVWRSRKHTIACPWGRPSVSVLADVKSMAQAICNRFSPAVG